METWCSLTVDAVLFDLDGVLVDSTTAVEGHWRRFAARYELDVERLLADLHGRRMLEIMASAVPWMDEGELRAAAEDMEAEEAAGAAHGTRPQPGALAVAGALAGMSWAIVTSGTAPVAEARIAAIDLPRPPVLVTGGDVARGKPAPDPYLRAARLLGMDPQRCVVIEDAPAGLRAAAAAGCTTIAVTTSHRPPELSTADHLVDTPADLHIERGESGSVRLALACRAHGGAP